MRALILYVTLFVFCSCKSTPETKLMTDTTPSASTSGPLKCAAIRGNGELIWGHYGSLAKILETDGSLYDGMAGASSGSISAFLYESILMNPALRGGCGEAPCSASVVAQRAALLLKTIYHWYDVGHDSKEGRALNHMATMVSQLKTFDASKLTSVSAVEIKTSLDSLHEILSSPILRDLVNPDFVHFITDPVMLKGDDAPSLALLRFRAREAQKSVNQFGQFDASTADIFFRPGPIDFHAIAMLVGHIADFYAGYAPDVNPEWQGFFDECTASGLGKLPWELLQGACGDRFKRMVDLFLNHQENINRHRVDDLVGTHTHVLAATAVLVSGKDKFEAAWARYNAGKPADLQLAPDNFKFGYTGTPADLAATAANIGASSDLKSSLFTSLGPMKWGDFLSVSPAEPGLTNVKSFTDGLGRTLYSFGGWADLSPVQVLKAVGCQNVTYITRKGEESAYAQAVAARAGFAAALDPLFSASNPSSSYYQAIHKADAIYCTNWDQFDGFSTASIQDIWRNSYKEGVTYTSSDPAAPVGCNK